MEGMRTGRQRAGVVALPDRAEMTRRLAEVAESSSPLALGLGRMEPLMQGAATQNVSAADLAVLLAQAVEIGLRGQPEPHVRTVHAELGRVVSALVDEPSIVDETCEILGVAAPLRPRSAPDGDS